MDSKFEKDLTTGKVWKQMLLFALPFFASNFIQSCLNLADMVIVSRFGGTNGLSGVSVGASIMVILTTLAAGLATGGTVVIGNYLGSGQREKINRVISTLFISLFAISLFFMLILITGADTFLNWVNAPYESFSEAKVYLIVCAIGLPFMFGYNAVSSVMRGLGDARTPMYFIFLACMVNVALDMLFVVGFNMGAMGAALATVISQGISVISSVIYLKLRDFMFDFRLSSFVFSKEEFWHIIRTGLPVSIQSVATNFSFLLLSSYNNLLGGVNVSAAVAVVMNFNGFAILPSHAINAAATAMISQNIGKGNYERSRKTVYVCLIMCIAVCAVVFSLVHLFPELIFKLFGAEEEVILCGIPYLLAFSFEYVGLPYIVGFNSYHTGTGRSWILLITTIFTSFIFRVPIAYYLGFKTDLGITGVAYSIPIATLVGAVLSFAFYMIFRNKKVSLTA